MPLASASITGPTSIASSRGSPTCSSCTAPCSISIRRSAPSSCTHSTRSAEQRWPALSKAEDTTSATTCSASADESTTIAFWPPVSAISGTAWPAARQAAGECALQQPRHLGRAGEQHAMHARVADQRRADGLAAAGQQLQRAARHAGRVQRAHRRGGHQRRLLGRLGQHHVAGGQRRGDLAGEDRQRKVPRADADHRAQRHGGWRCRSRAASRRA